MTKVFLSALLTMISILLYSQQEIHIHVYSINQEQKEPIRSFKTYIKNSQSEEIDTYDNDTIILLKQTHIRSDNVLFVEVNSIAIPINIDTLSAEYELHFDKSINNNHCQMQWSSNYCGVDYACLNYKQEKDKPINIHHFVLCNRIKLPNCFPDNWNPCDIDNYEEK